MSEDRSKNKWKNRLTSRRSVLSGLGVASSALLAGTATGAKNQTYTRDIPTSSRYGEFKLEEGELVFTGNLDSHRNGQLFEQVIEEINELKRDGYTEFTQRSGEIYLDIDEFRSDAVVCGNDVGTNCGGGGGGGGGCGDNSWDLSTGVPPFDPLYEITIEMDDSTTQDVSYYVEMGSYAAAAGTAVAAVTDISNVSAAVLGVVAAAFGALSATLDHVNDGCGVALDITAWSPPPAPPIPSLSAQ